MLPGRAADSRIPDAGELAATGVLALDLVEVSAKARTGGPVDDPAMVGPRHWMLERAMREWARSEPAVAVAVRESDQRVVDAVREAFLDDGFDPEEADMRANATFAAGIGFLHLSGSRPNPQAAGRRERFLEVMLRH